MVCGELRRHVVTVGGFAAKTTSRGLKLCSRGAYRSVQGARRKSWAPRPFSHSDPAPINHDLWRLADAKMRKLINDLLRARVWPHRP